MKMMNKIMPGKYHHIVIENILTIQKVIVNRFKNIFHEQVVFSYGFITTN